MPRTVLMDGHVHHIAYALWLLGNPEIRRVYAEYGSLNSGAQVEDNGVTILRTDRAICEISGSNRLHEPNDQNLGEFKERIEIFGSRGTIHLHPTDRPSLRVYLPDASDGDELLQDGWIAPRLERVPQLDRAYAVHFNPDENPWVREHEHFIAACLDEVPLDTDGRFGRRVQEVLAAAYRSGAQGRAERLAPEVEAAR